MRCRTARGLTLIECLVSIVILGVGLVGLMQCINAALSTDMRANRFALAAARAQTLIEEVRSYSAPNFIFQATSVEGQTLSLTRAVPDTTALPNGTEKITIADYTASSALTGKISIVTVVITWTARTSKTDRVTLTTYVSNRAK